MSGGSLGNERREGVNGDGDCPARGGLRSAWLRHNVECMGIGGVGFTVCASCSVFLWVTHRLSDVGRSDVHVNKTHDVTRPRAGSGLDPSRGFHIG